MEDFYLFTVLKHANYKKTSVSREQQYTIKLLIILSTLSTKVLSTQVLPYKCKEK